MYDSRYRNRGVERSAFLIVASQIQARTMQVDLLLHLELRQRFVRLGEDEQIVEQEAPPINDGEAALATQET